MTLTNPAEEILTPQASTDIGVSVRRLWEDAVQSRMPINEAMINERRFLFEFAHYEDERPLERDQTRIRPRSGQAFSKHRHKKAAIMRMVGPYFDLRPQDPESTVEDAEQSRALMMSEWNDPNRHAKRVLDRAVSSMLASRLGCAVLEVDRKRRIVPRFLDAINYYWTPGWQDGDDPTCPWEIEERRMRIVDIRAMKQQGWKNTEQVTADDGSLNPRASSNVSNSAGYFDLRSKSGQPQPTPWNRMDSATVVLCWFKFDDTKVPKDVIGPDGNPETRTVDPEQRYMACAGPEGQGHGCGYTEKPDDGSGLPEVGGKCPTCGGLMVRVDEEVLTTYELQYPDGRLVIVAPGCNQVLYDGPWPWKIRSSPYLAIPCYENPFAQIGFSDTTTDWDPTLIINALDRKVYNQIMASGGVIVTSDPLTKADSSDPFEFTDDPISVATWTGQGAPTVEFFQPNMGGVGPVIEFRNTLSAAFQREGGTADFALTGPDLKGIDVGTIQQATQTQEVPVQDHVAMIQERLGPWIGVWYDMWRDLNGARTMVPMPADSGQFEWVKKRGSDLKNFHFNVISTPDWKQADAERAQAFDALLNTPPQMREAKAEAMGIAPSIVMKINAAEQKAGPPPPALKDVATLLNDIGVLNKDAPGIVEPQQIQFVLSLIPGMPPPQGNPALHPNLVQPLQPMNGNGPSGPMNGPPGPVNRIAQVAA